MGVIGATERWIVGSVDHAGLPAECCGPATTSGRPSGDDTMGDAVSGPGVWGPEVRPKGHHPMESHLPFVIRVLIPATSATNRCRSACSRSSSSDSGQWK
jgi:hypothetical protein